ncbi:3-oxoacyl-ACP reductase family protein [Anoxybacillus sp. J5B_2022]|uniref:3-oxoacyl-ACP reductase family protein n=1 Tax=Anoxybacillus sp. J5B_2022 TaxID=3003246 RepID=UPI002286B5DA|nr:3-oxoacyl-ACP reductase family protein [Anoxybacillus sp. J5B_2022]MCZ0754130.1 3-oxoacyl-ACP reductase FabG [Anoxybacillus sp. J5B_2022]
MLLRDKVAVVTGASRGIGREIAITFAREGALVVLNFAHNLEGTESIVQEIRENGGQAEMFQADVSKETEAEALINFTCDRFGRIDILVNNAGVTKDGLLINMSIDDWNYVISNNLCGTFLCCKFALRKMVRQRYGKIINMSSISGLLGNAGQSNYAASKAGIIGLTKSIAQEYSAKGITANVISPGVVDTEMSRRVPTEVKQMKVDTTLLKRPGTTSEIAGVALFLASSLSDFVNGAVIRADGGIRF